MTPTLTVEETLRFAFQTFGASETVGDSAEDYHRNKDDGNYTEYVRQAGEVKLRAVLKTLGIDHVRETIVGNAQIRGLSGGQRRRVTIAEVMMGKARVIAGDEVTTGLDAATTVAVVRGFRDYGRAVKATTLLALLQPPPESLLFFDDVIILQRGRIAFHGSVDDAVTFFEEKTVSKPHRQDAADYLVDVAATSPVDLGKAFSSSSSKVATPVPSDTTWPAYYRDEFTLPLSTYVQLVLRRYLVEMSKEPSYVIVRAVQSLVMALFTGTLFRALNYDDFAAKFGFMFSAILYLCLASMAAIPPNLERREIFYRHRDLSYYPTLAYALANVIVEVVLQITEAVVFISIAFWPTKLAVNGFGHALAVLVLVSLAMSQLYAVVAAVAPTGKEAQPLAGFFVVAAILYSGFIAPRKSLPHFWRWMYWVSPMSWAFRVLAIVEFRSKRYTRKECKYQRDDLGCPSIFPCCVTRDDGIFFLRLYDVPVRRRLVTMAYAALIGYTLLSIFVFIAALHYLRVSAQLDPAFLPDFPASSEKEEEEDDKAVIPPFEKASLVFKNITYRVRVGRDELELLGGITGDATPGTMTCLMGSSGAGKTTLLDTLAGRKTSGTIAGDILVNGHRMTKDQFAKISAYVEQLDVFLPSATVGESVRFSAALRLENASETNKEAFCGYIINALDLEDIQNRQVGGLTFDQRKRLGVAVELASNPAILFLDEPTSGLDARAALGVITATRRVGAGRAVVCTIHQPSYALFCEFDRLLLLKRGGRTVFFGDIGPDAASLVAYFREAAGALQSHDFPLSVTEHQGNPATWMLGACDARDADFASYYYGSDLKKHHDANDVLGTTTILPRGQRRGFAQEMHETAVLYRRMATTYYRDPSYNVARGVVSVAVGALFASCAPKRRPKAVDSFTDVISRVGLLYVATFFVGIVFFISALPAMAVEREVFYREKAARIYKTGPYSLSFMLAEAPFLIVYAVAHVGVFWAIHDAYPGTDRFFFHVAFFGLYVSSMTFFGQFLVAALPDQATAQTLGTAILVVTSLVGGLNIQPQDIPDYFIALYWIAPIHYAFEGIIVTQFHNADASITDLPGQPTIHNFFTSHDTDSFFGGFFTYSHRFQNILVLLTFCTIFRLGTLAALHHINYRSV